MLRTTTRPLVIQNSNQGKKIRTKVVEQRKEELKGIFKVFEDLSKKEVERSKQIYEDHLSWFNEPEYVSTEPVVTVKAIDDSFFEK